MSEVWRGFGFGFGFGLGVVLSASCIRCYPSCCPRTTAEIGVISTVASRWPTAAIEAAAPRRLTDISAGDTSHAVPDAEGLTNPLQWLTGGDKWLNARVLQSLPDAWVNLTVGI